MVDRTREEPDAGAARQQGKRSGDGSSYSMECALKSVLIASCVVVRLLHSLADRGHALPVPQPEQPCAMLRARGLAALLEISRAAHGSYAAENSSAGAAAWSAGSGFKRAALPAACSALCETGTWSGNSQLCAGLAWDSWQRGLHTGGSSSGGGGGGDGETQAVAPQHQQQRQPVGNVIEKHVLYRGRGMRLFRVLVRCVRALEGGRLQCQARCLPRRLQPPPPPLSHPPSPLCLTHDSASRLKVFQLAGIAALAVPINTFLATGDVSGTQVGAV